MFPNHSSEFDGHFSPSHSLQRIYTTHTHGHVNTLGLELVDYALVFFLSLLVFELSHPSFIQSWGEFTTTRSDREKNVLKNEAREKQEEEAWASQDIELTQSSRVTMAWPAFPVYLYCFQVPTEPKFFIKNHKFYVSFFSFTKETTERKELWRRKK